MIIQENFSENDYARKFRLPSHALCANVLDGERSVCVKRQREEEN